MFCFQCEQTEKGTGCTTVGVCGKTPEVASLQDLTIYQLKNACSYLNDLSKEKVDKNLLDKFHDFLTATIYATLTNVNFDPKRFVSILEESESYIQKFKKLTNVKYYEEVLTKECLENEEKLVNIGKKHSLTKRTEVDGDSVVKLQELVQYGIKGMAAYYKEAKNLKQNDPEIDEFIVKTMAFINSGRDAKKVDALVSLALECGKYNARVLALLDKGHNQTFGSPSPQKVRTSTVEGKCILVSGHDVGVLRKVLELTEGTGINVYTHGELLPAHGYPELKKFKHLVGNYGGAWQLQKFDFASFPGSILVTTNCIIEPRKQYKDRIFTTGQVGWPDVKNLSGDFTELIDAAKNEKGFSKTEPEKYVLTGFGHNYVLSLAPIIVNAVKKGDIKKFWLIGGCDGSEGERNYFTNLGKSLPEDNVILTLGCGKYRLLKHDHGTIKTTHEGKQIELPRLLDLGQCNDSYSAVVIANALVGAFELKSVNDLPLEFAISWFEQKAVAVLLTLLSMGVKNIRLGPNLPAFATPILDVLVKDFGMQVAK